MDPEKKDELEDNPLQGGAALEENEHRGPTQVIPSQERRPCRAREGGEKEEAAFHSGLLLIAGRRHSCGRDKLIYSGSAGGSCCHDGRK
jgi:hypothetical protein